MPNQIDEAELTVRATHGDTAAFAELYTRLLPGVYRYVYFRVSNQHDAEDLTEQVFLKMWQHLPRYEGKKLAIRALLYRVAHNTVIDFYRTRKQPAQLPPEPLLPDPAPGPERRLVEQEQIEQVARMISRLSPIHQHILTLRFISELSVNEVADVVERSPGAVRVLQHRALKAAQALLAAEEIIHV